MFLLVLITTVNYIFILEKLFNAYNFVKIASNIFVSDSFSTLKSIKYPILPGRIQLTPVDQFSIRNKIFNSKNKFDLSLSVDSQSNQESTKVPDESTPEKSQDKILKGVVVAAIIGAIIYFCIDSVGGININYYLQQIVKKVEDLGPYGPLYFALVFQLQY